MPHWLVIALTGLWVLETLWLLAVWIRYQSLYSWERRVFHFNARGLILIYSYILLTIFFGSWVIFG